MVLWGTLGTRVFEPLLTGRRGTPGYSRVLTRGRLHRCTHLEALEPLLKGAPQNILKYAVHQFAKVREGVPREYFHRCEYPTVSTLHA